jgi:hypothetical protein
MVGFNHMLTGFGEVAPNVEIFLRQPNGKMLSLGTRSQASARAPGTKDIIGKNGDYLGNFGTTPDIKNNLFIKRPDGGKSRRSNKAIKSRRSRKSLRKR